LQAAGNAPLYRSYELRAAQNCSPDFNENSCCRLGQQLFFAHSEAVEKLKRIVESLDTGAAEMLGSVFAAHPFFRLGHQDQLMNCLGQSIAVQAFD
jgi:hypothetical protein